MIRKTVDNIAIKKPGNLKLPGTPSALSKKITTKRDLAVKPVYRFDLDSTPVIRPPLTNIQPSELVIEIFGTRSQILQREGDPIGTIAFATDTFEIMVYNTDGFDKWGSHSSPILPSQLSSVFSSSELRFVQGAVSAPESPVVLRNSDRYNPIMPLENGVNVDPLQFYISMWVKPYSTGALLYFDNDEHYVGINPSGAIVWSRVGVSTHSTFKTANNAITFSEWNHIVISSGCPSSGNNDGNPEIFVNGVSAGQSWQEPNPLPTYMFTLGSSWGGGNFFDGKIDEIAVWTDTGQNYQSILAEITVNGYGIFIQDAGSNYDILNTLSGTNVQGKETYTLSGANPNNYRIVWYSNPGSLNFNGLLDTTNPTWVIEYDNSSGFGTHKDFSGGSANLNNGSLAIPASEISIMGGSGMHLQYGIHHEVSPVTMYNGGKTFNLLDSSKILRPKHWWRMGDGPSDTDSIINDIAGGSHAYANASQLALTFSNETPPS